MRDLLVGCKGEHCMLTKICKRFVKEPEKGRQMFFEPPYEPGGYECKYLVVSGVQKLPEPPKRKRSIYG